MSQKNNKKTFYLSILLILIFGFTGYLLLSNFVWQANSPDGQEVDPLNEIMSLSKETKVADIEVFSGQKFSEMSFRLSNIKTLEELAVGKTNPFRSN